MKKLSLVLCVFLIIPLFISCNASPISSTPSDSPSDSPSVTPTETTGAVEEGSIITAPGELPLVTEPTKLLFGIQQNVQITDYDDNYLTKLFETNTGIDLEFYFFPTNNTEAQQQLELLIVGNAELPDIISTLALSDSARASYGRKGIFLDLKGLIEDYGYWIKPALEFLDETTREKLWIYGTSPDGGFYGWPYYNDSYSGVVDQTFAAINQTWLDVLDLEYPETTEELYNVLVAFRDNDPNGNNEQDEIPMVGSINGNENPYWYLLNCFTYMQDNFLVVEDGAVNVCYTSDAFREGLEYMHRLVSEGLLYSGSFTQERAQLKSMIDLPTQDDTIVGSFFGYYTLLTSTTEENAKILEYVNLRPVLNPRGTTYSTRKGEVFTYTTYITKDCESPEVAARFLDYLNEKEIALIIRWGELGVNWRYATADEGLKYPKSGYKPLVTQLKRVWGQENNVIWNNNLSRILAEGYIGTNTYKPGDNPIYNYQTDIFIDMVESRRNDGLYPSERIDKIIYTDEELSEIIDIETALKNYVNESIARFAVGDLNIETDWDTYLSNLNSMGLSEYLDVVNTAYTRMKSLN